MNETINIRGVPEDDFFDYLNDNNIPWYRKLGGHDVVVITSEAKIKEIKSKFNL